MKKKKKLMKKRNAPSHAKAPFCTDIAQLGSSRIAPNHPKPRNDHFLKKKSPKYHPKIPLSANLTNNI